VSPQVREILPKRGVRLLGMAGRQWCRRGWTGLKVGGNPPGGREDDLSRNSRVNGVVKEKGKEFAVRIRAQKGRHERLERVRRKEGEEKNVLKSTTFLKPKRWKEQGGKARSANGRPCSQEHRKIWTLQRAGAVQGGREGRPGEWSTN